MRMDVLQQHIITNNQDCWLLCCCLFFSLHFVIAFIVMFVLKYCFCGVLHFLFLGLVSGYGISAYFLKVEIPHQNSKSKTYKQKYQGNNTKNEHQQKYENEIPRKEKSQHINPALTRNTVIRLRKYCVCI
jgi:flagellar biosynthesis component FlhA